jgi:D-aspartate ligase
VTTPCFVLGLFDTGLAVVRALGRAGLPVFGFDSRHGEYGFLSRYGAHEPCPHPYSSPAALLDFLVERARQFSSRPILYPTSDVFVAFVSDRREELDPYFRYALPGRDAVEAAINKASQYARAVSAGIPIPFTHSPATLADVHAVAASMQYPVVMKPSVSHLRPGGFNGDKARQVDDPATLIALYETMLGAGQPVLVQSLVVGGNSSHCKVCGYFDREGEPRAVMCMRKVRQYPVDFGVGTLMETVDDPELRELGLRFFRSMDWRGPGSIEFKRDSRDGRWKLIELNPRLWQQNGLAAACGMSFPLIQYLDLTGQARASTRYPLGVRWIDEFRDPRSAWIHVSQKQLTFAQWARSLRRVRAFALWASDDPAPFVAAAKHHAALAGRRVFAGPH